MPAAALTPLSEEDYDTLAELLEDRSPFDTDGVLGMLHAVAVAPSLMPPSAWLPVILPNGADDLEPAVAQRFIGLVLRLYNEVLAALDKHSLIAPLNDDQTACESFAAGYAAGAELDPLWIDDPDHWTFASGIAYLGGRVDLVPEDMRAELDAQPDAKLTLCRDLDGIIAATHESFLKVRRAAFSRAAPTQSPVARVGRNETCPCGSGKKYKRCCIDRARTAGAR
jgi:uncharacterized protein